MIGRPKRCARQRMWPGSSELPWRTERLSSPSSSRARRARPTCAAARSARRVVERRAQRRGERPAVISSGVDAPGSLDRLAAVADAEGAQQRRVQQAVAVARRVERMEPHHGTTSSFGSPNAAPTAADHRRRGVDLRHHVDRLEQQSDRRLPRRAVEAGTASRGSTKVCSSGRGGAAAARERLAVGGDDERRATWSRSASASSAGPHSRSRGG